jgi:RHS repeat-associated protein
MERYSYEETETNRVIEEPGPATRLKTSRNGANVVATLKTSCDSLVAEYVNGASIDEPIVMTRDSTDYWYMQTALNGSVAALVDSSGAIQEGYKYTAYGEATILTGAGNDGNWFTSDDVAASTSAVGNPYLYTARRLDDETGLMYFRFRMYDVSTGRFISRDPLGYVDGMSMYVAYFAPLGIDPYGLTRWLSLEGDKDDVPHSALVVECPFHADGSPTENGELNELVLSWEGGGGYIYEYDDYMEYNSDREIYETEMDDVDDQSTYNFWVNDDDNNYDVFAGKDNSGNCGSKAHEACDAGAGEKGWMGHPVPSTAHAGRVNKGIRTVYGSSSTTKTNDGTGAGGEKCDRWTNDGAYDQKEDDASASGAVFPLVALALWVCWASCRRRRRCA